MDLIFCTTAPVVLCLGFVTKMRLIAHQCFGYCWIALARVSEFSVFHSLPPVSRLGVNRWLGGSTMWAAGSGWLEGYSMPYNVMLRSENWGDEVFGEVAIAERLASASVYFWKVVIAFCILCFVFSVPSHIKLYQQISSLVPFLVLPSCRARGWEGNECRVVLSCCPRSSHHTHRAVSARRLAAPVGNSGAQRCKPHV